MKLFYLFLILSTLLFAEPSAFGEGSLENRPEYSLNETEKYILKNIKEIKLLKLKITTLRKNLNFNLRKSLKVQNIKIDRKFEAQHKEIDNLESKIQKQSFKLNNIELRLEGLNSILPSFDRLNQSIIAMQAKFTSFHQLVIKDRTILNDKIDTLKNKITSLNKNIELLQINNKALEDNISSFATIIEKMATELDKLKESNRELRVNLSKIQQKESDFRSQPKYKIFNLAQEYYNKKEYAKAYEFFDYLLKEEYKPATSSFYLGEIYYYKNGDYKTALSFYKKSIGYYSKKASFSDTLLYHTGYSLEKLGQTRSAIKSYQKLIRDYKHSKLVSYAKRRLSKLLPKKEIEMNDIE